MSIFYCHRCDELRDADDGCAEDPGDRLELICVECMQDDESDLEDLIYAHAQEAAL